MVSTQVELCSIPLANPIIPAAGCFGYGAEFARLYDLNCLGSFCCKGTTREPRSGNPAPRIAETPGGMLHAVGLQNPGIDHVLANELPAIADFFSKPVMVNVSGFSIEEYAEVCQKLDSCPQVGWIEVNLHCPDVQGGGMRFGADPSLSAQLTRAVRAATRKPVIVKLTPDVGDIVEIACACEDAGADGISLINALPGMRIDLGRRSPLLGHITGGLSGGAIFPVALRMVWEVYEAVDIPIIGMGGVSGAEDVLEMMLAGATAVGIGTANLVQPYICRDIVETLPTTMEAYGISGLENIIGGAH